jgi:hypothetical protein
MFVASLAVMANEGRAFRLVVDKVVRCRPCRRSGARGEPHEFSLPANAGLLEDVVGMESWRSSSAERSAEI